MEVTDSKVLKESRTEILLRQVESTIARDSSDKKDIGPACAYSKLYSLASTKEKTLMYIGWICAAITGLGMPSFAFLMGDIINAFGPGGDLVATVRKIAFI